MNRLDGDTRARIVAALVEGNSIRATCRMTGASKNTVTKLLSDLGLVCSIYMDRVMRDLPCERIQVDEIWTFVGCKEKRVTAEKRGGDWGDLWTWVAIDADTKLVPSFVVGGRGYYEAYVFLSDLRKRLSSDRIQLTSDGHTSYLNAVRETFGRNIDYAQVVKVYAAKGDGRYSPADLRDTETTVISGNPDPAHISTSYVERQNLTMRMSMRRFTRLTNGFSRKVENHVAAVALHFMHYNFARPHKSLKGRTPAMAAGISDHVWTVREIVGLLEAAENVPTRRGTYKKRAA